MHEILEKLDDCERRLSELLIESATNDSEANSPIKPVYPENSDEIVYMSRTRKGTILSKMVIERINDMQIEFGNKLRERTAGTQPDYLIDLENKRY